MCNSHLIINSTCTVHKLLYALAIVILFYSCANEMSPTGGPADKTAPSLQSRSVQDSVLNFKGGTIVYEFDEKLNTDNIKVETFPLLKDNPKITINKRKLLVTIPDSLLEENTTYKISFKNAIKDITEGNAVPSLDFTFSTGNVLDTLHIIGTVTKAATGEPDTSAWIYMYPQLEKDSDLFYKKPLYAVKTNQAGGFEISNLPNKEFFVYAVGETNGNYKLDYPMESLGFLPTTIMPYMGRTIALNFRTFSLVDTATKTKSNTARLSNNNAVNFSTNIDTSLKMVRTFDITKPVTITFYKPITNWNRGKVRLYLGTELDETGTTLFDSVKNAIIINTDFIKDTVYTLHLLDSFASNTTTSFAGNKYVFRTKKDADYGNLKIKIDSFVTNKQYIQLVQNNNLLSSRLITDSVVTFNYLSPGNYTLRLFTDDNNNGRWDNGKYFVEKKQPELIQKYKAEVIIKANWQNSIDWFKTNK